MDPRDQHSRWAAIGAGARSGVSATATMSAAFSMFETVGWLGQFPPRQPVDRVLGQASEPVIRIATLGAHFGYGALAGSCYSLLKRSPSPLSGAAFGIAVCIVSYEGWMPLFGIRSPLHRDQPREVAAMIIAHLVYGATLGRRLAAKRRHALI